MLYKISDSEEMHLVDYAYTDGNNVNLIETSINPGDYIITVGGIDDDGSGRTKYALVWLT